MNEKKARLLAIILVALLAISGMAAFFIFTAGNKKPSLAIIRVACVGDSITQSTEYPLDLMLLLGRERYIVGNFGAGSTTVSLSSETPYMNTSRHRNALEFAPNIVIIMLGTNDAQPSLFRYNTSFVGDYLKLIQTFQMLPSKPKILLVLPPPIFSNRSGTISPDYFNFTVIPLIEQTANETRLPLVNVYSVLTGYSDYFPDGVHPNTTGAQIIAEKIYMAVISQNYYSVFRYPQ